jgi:ABC-2 type transport system ATP-binding protein
MQPIILTDINKNYGPVKAVQDVSLSVEEGEIFGLIGPDGAGKTSIMRMIVSLLIPDSGSILFMGKNVNENISFVRSNIGYMPQRFSLYPDLSVEENLLFFGDLFKVSQNIQEQRLKRLYEFSQLGPFKKRFAGALSGGMKQKLALSCMLMHEPRVMILDEPTFGVDPVSRLEFWEILNELRNEGITLLVSTPYMDEAKRCNRIGLTNEGRILSMDTPGKIIDAFPYPLYRFKTETPHIIYNQLIKILNEQDIQLYADGVHLIDRHSMGLKNLLNSWKGNVHFNKMPEQIKPDLENVFLDLMYNQKRDHE